MATTHHPAPAQVGFGHHHEWLWITIGAVIVGLIAATISWAIMRDDTEPAALPSTVTGYEYDHEVTPIHMPVEGVTATYVGVSGELWPEPSEVDHEVTSMHLPPEEPVTSEFVGSSG